MLLYYITDRSQFGGDEVSRRKKLLEKIAEAATCRVDFIQLREKDLSTRDLELLAHDAMRLIREHSPQVENNDRRATWLLINSRTDVAIGSGADGVHLRSEDVSPGIAREVWKQAQQASGAKAAISVACHTVAEVGVAAHTGANYALFGPVFEKRNAESGSAAIDATPTGLGLLREACNQKIPVIALGGIAFESARSCIDAGATGIAGIRIFQKNPIERVLRQLRD